MGGDRLAMIEWQIPVSGPLDFELSCYRYEVWGEDLANRYVEGRFRRIIKHRGRRWLYEIGRVAGDDPERPVRARLLAVDEGQLPDEASALARSVVTAVQDEVTRMFSLDADPEEFYQLAENCDPTLAALCRGLRGYRLTRAATLFEALVTSITAQQINLPFAFRVRNRLIEAYGRTVSFQSERHYAFPDPAALADAAPETLRAMQFSNRKAAYIIGLARAMAVGELIEHEASGLENDEFVSRLCREPGIGRWTAEWALIRALGRPDVIPADDLGVQQAVGRFYFDGTRPKGAEVRQLAERWRPWRSWATYYLLAGLRYPPSDPIR